MPDALFNFDNSYARDLPGCYVAWPPAPVKTPQLLFLNRELADELRLDLAAHEESTLAAIFSGNALPEDATPIAQAYACLLYTSPSPRD